MLPDNAENMRPIINWPMADICQISGPPENWGPGIGLTRQCSECVMVVVWKTSSAERRAAPAGIIVFHLPNSASENHSDALGGTNDSSAFHFTILAGTVHLVGSDAAASTSTCAHAACSVFV
jgi:hypothetical protein